MPPPWIRIVTKTRETNKTVVFSTLLSLVTMPLILLLAQSLG